MLRSTGISSSTANKITRAQPAIPKRIILAILFSVEKAARVSKIGRLNR
jgi:hypothetical protein